VPVVRLAVAACVLLVLTACGASHTSDEDMRQALSTPSPTVAAERSELANGAAQSLGRGVSLRVSEPTSFTPTDTAYPRAARAVAFELVVANDGDDVYRPAQMSFVATANGAATDQVIDSTQGYTGVVGIVDEVRPDEELRFAVAFAVPAKTCVVRVSVWPDSPEEAAVPIFDGAV
jgi:hypothetical protein